MSGHKGHARKRTGPDRLVPIDRFMHALIKDFEAAYKVCESNFGILKEIFDVECGLQLDSTEGFRLLMSFVDPDLAGVQVSRDGDGVATEVSITKKFQDLEELTKFFDDCEEKSAELDPDYDEDGPSITLAGIRETMDQYFSPDQLFSAFAHTRWEAYASAHFKQCALTAGSFVTRMQTSADPIL